jgi:hypothetical protein
LVQGRGDIPNKVELAWQRPVMGDLMVELSEMEQVGGIGCSSPETKQTTTTVMFLQIR